MAKTVGNRIGLRLMPLDVLAFRDGRPFDTGSTAKSVMPLPQTLSGSIRTALLEKYRCDFKKLAAKVQAGCAFPEAVAESGAPAWIATMEFRGPWIAKQRKEELIPYLPAPATLHIEKDDPKGLHAIQPLTDKLNAPGWRPHVDEPKMRPLWPRTNRRTEALNGLISPEGLSRFLNGDSIDPSHVLTEKDLQKIYQYDERTGIGINPMSLSTEEGLIYSISFLSLNSDACFYAEAVLPQESPIEAFDGIDTVSFGGESRRVLLTCTSPLIWPEVVPADSGEKTFLLLTTPAFFKGRWKPEALTGNIAGAAVAGYIPISGWDLAKRGPKQTRFAVPAGSVYFLSELHPNLPATLTDSIEDGQSGYGCYLKGVWRNE